ncbi:MAG: ATP-binding cassette domain-containing protein [Armatimonadia bacterium]|nr:ATP-binding cassette domain-containing protein [Armatimonadia bacterium]
MITIEEVSKTFPDGTEAVKDLSLEIEEGETVVLLGTSGSGKTTTMKMVNRLIEPTSGRISVDGQDIMDQDPVQLRRHIGYAIQSIGLFPHMTLGENISVVPQLLGWDQPRTDDHVDQLLNMVQLEPEVYRDRFPSQLSGGQRQRVGVARSLAGDPPVVLMDEPFGALDPITREQLQNEFLELEDEIKKTVVFVTHDVFEAVKMGDRIALLDAGELQQLSSPAELVDNPANEFVSQFLGQQRFQLALVTRTLEFLLDKGIVERTDEELPDGPSLSRHDSLIQALDRFKTTGETVLPIRGGGRAIGELSKKKLLSIIAEVLGESGEESQ